MGIGRDMIGYDERRPKPCKQTSACRERCCSRTFALGLGSLRWRAGGRGGADDVSLVGGGERQPLPQPTFSSACSRRRSRRGVAEALRPFVVARARPRRGEARDPIALKLEQYGTSRHFPPLLDCDPALFGNDDDSAFRANVLSLLATLPSATSTPPRSSPPRAPLRSRRRAHGLRFARGHCFGLSGKKSEASKMRFWSLLTVAWLPVLQVLLVGLLGALLASNRLNVLTSDARRNINKIVYMSSFHRSSSLAWRALSRSRTSSPGNWGTIPLMIVPAICNEEGSPFGDTNTCNSLGLSYVSLSMALGNFYIWTHSYSVMKRSSKLYKSKCKNHHARTDTSKEHLGQDATDDYVAFVPPASENFSEDVGNSIISPLPSDDARASFLSRYLRAAKDLLVEALKELWSPPSIAALVGFTVGAIDKMKSLVTEEGYPLRVIQDSTKLLGDATIPCTVLILGGNLTKGIGKTVIEPIVVISIIVIRYIVLPACGIGIVTAATKLGFLPRSPLYRYVLLLQSTVPPAMSIGNANSAPVVSIRDALYLRADVPPLSAGTIAQLFDVGEEECSIIFLWRHLVAALALTLWSTVFMSLVLRATSTESSLMEIRWH
ncbi:hypothetical protein C2845_PM01G01780 [Panicum miliaceum]|uniref:Uncharacterized protein n=1 Tax=Panicum miliaceum TaxID=4540 RepID=A0A3L6TJI4_PANMI|nr:hypothetical protein C2845_PM01G01780 [Panicum miliaceum]